MTCKDCKYCKECIMSYPDGNWKPCKDFELKKESEETETWNGIHAHITAPKGTFERIFNDANDDDDI